MKNISTNVSDRGPIKGIPTEVALFTGVNIKQSVPNEFVEKKRAVTDETIKVPTYKSEESVGTVCLFKMKNLSADPFDIFGFIVNESNIPLVNIIRDAKDGRNEIGIWVNKCLSQNEKFIRGRQKWGGGFEIEFNEFTEFIIDKKFPDGGAYGKRMIKEIRVLGVFGIEFK